MTYDDWQPLYLKLTKAYGKPTSGEQCAAYFEALEDFSADRMREAVTRSIADVKFFPKAAELKDRAQASARRAPTAPQDCDRCHGSTWVPGPPKVLYGRTYETVERCSACWTVSPTREPATAGEW